MIRDVKKMHVDDLKGVLQDLFYERDRLEYDLSFVQDDIDDIERELERREELDD